MLFNSKILLQLTSFCSLEFYRSRYYVFEEYLGQWYEKLKEDKPTTMTVRLQQEIEKYKVFSFRT